MILCVAWVLWSILTAPDAPATWRVLGARETRADCELMAKAPPGVPGESAATGPTEYRRELLCLPVGLDPRPR